MLRARLLVWWLAVARALPVGDQTASDWAWGWWQSPPHPLPTEAEPPLIVLEDAARASPRPHARLAEATKAVTEELQRNAKEALERIDYWSPTPSPSPRPRVPLDLTFMEAVDDWTPRMKREYLRELKRERES